MKLLLHALVVCIAALVSGGEKAGEVSEEFLRDLQEWATGVLAKK